MINVVGKTNGRPVSSLSFDLLTPSKQMKLVAVRLKHGAIKEKEASALYDYTKEMENLISCTTVKSLIGSTIEPVEVEFGSVESAIAAKKKLDSLNTNSDWSGWTVYSMFFNAPITNPLPSS